MLNDSRAAVNIIDEIAYNQIESKPVVCGADTRIFAYGSHLCIRLASLHTARIFAYGSEEAMMLLGSFETVSRYKERAVKVVFHVTKSKGECLLSYIIASQLELISIHFNTLATIKH